MRHDDFIGQVQARARLSSRGDAETATRATLETLGERIPEPLAENLASQLPREIGGHLRRTIVAGGAASGERFGLDEFTQRVAVRAAQDEPKAGYSARAVLEVVREATTGGVIDHVRQALPGELRDLVDTGSSGQLR